MKFEASKYNLLKIRQIKQTPSFLLIRLFINSCYNDLMNLRQHGLIVRLYLNIEHKVLKKKNIRLTD